MQPATDVEFFVLAFPDGKLHSGSYWRRSEKFTGAKLYASIGNANRAIAYHGLRDKGVTVLKYRATLVL